MIYYETSAKTAQGVEEAFIQGAQILIKKKELELIDKKNKYKNNK
jgi:hypothetical protein